jgi:hypothetical protein
MPDWISVDEADDVSGYNTEYLRRLVRSKQIKAEKKGRDWWVDHASLLAYIQSASTSGDKRRGPRQRYPSDVQRLDKIHGD